MGQWLQPQRIQYKYMAHVTQHLLTCGEQVTKIWSTNFHCADAQSLSLSIIKVTCNIDHVSCMWVHMLLVCAQLKLKINTRSLSNQALKSAHQSLLSVHCWPWWVFSSWLASHVLGIAGSSYLEKVGPMLMWAHQKPIFVHANTCLMVMSDQTPLENLSLHRMIKKPSSV